ncbi:MAG: hypothetical protein ABSF77_18770 [Spirochaetia bacterium]|jgi:hypothetical protein
MKTARVTLFLMLISIALMLITACTPKLYTPKGNEEIYGTWTNPEAGRQKLLEQPDGTWKTFIYSNDTVPSESGTYQLIKKWKDPLGNTWYYENSSQLTGAISMGNQQGLVKIDATGKTIEFSSLDIGKFDNKTYPKEIDTKNDSYGFYHRSE